MRGKQRHAWSAVLVSLLSSSAIDAAAQPLSAQAPPTIALDWSGPGPEADCLGAERLIDAVDEYLGRAAFTAAPADISLHVRVERSASGWRALVQLGESASGRVLGERELVTEDLRCASLEEPLKLTVALLVDSDLSAPAPPPPPVAPPPKPVMDLDETAPPATHAATAVQVRPRIVADLGVLAEFEALPALSPGIELGVGVAPWRWLLLRVSGTGYLPQGRNAGASEVGFTLAYAGASLCPAGSAGERWELALCAGVRAGTLFVDASELEHGRLRQRHFLAASLALRPSFRINRRMALFGSWEALLVSRPQRLVYDLDSERTTLFKQKSPAWALGLGCSVSF